MKTKTITCGETTYKIEYEPDPFARRLNRPATRLVKALESDEYEQGSDFLTQRCVNKKDKDCCFGVGCKLYNQLYHDLNIKVADIGDGVVEGESAPVMYDGDTELLPKVVQNWLGFNSNTGQLYKRAYKRAGSLVSGVRINGQKFINLTAMNDDKIPFPVIAAVIRLRPRYLFKR